MIQQFPILRYPAVSHRLCSTGLGILLLLLLAIGELAPIGGAAAVPWWADAGWTLCAALACAGCLTAAGRGGVERRAWLYVAGACGSWLCGQLVWNYYQLVLHIGEPFPSLSDAGWLGFVPLSAAGLFALPRYQRRHSAVAILVLDFAIVALALALIGIAATQGLLRAATAISPLGKAIALGYPVGYLTLGLGAFLLMVRVPALAAAPGMGLLLLGLLCEGMGFVGWVPSLLSNTYRDGTPIDMVWMAGLLAIGFAGLEWRPLPDAQSIADGTRLVDDSIARTRVILGFVPIVLGTLAALIAPPLTAGPAHGPAEVGACVLIALIAFRQFGAVFDNMRLYRAETRQRSLAERRAERLRRVQALGQAVRLDLDPVRIGQLTVEAVSDARGYRLAILNLIFNPHAASAEQRIRAVAAVGLAPEVAAQFMAQDAPAADVVLLLREQFRLSRSFFLPVEQATTLLQQTSIPQWTAARAPAAVGGWQAGDEFLVPLIAPRTNHFIGFLSVDDPADGRRPDAETAEILEIFADQAALAIDNASLYAESRRRMYRSEAVGALLHALGQHVAVDAVLRTGLDGLVRLLSAQGAALFDYDAPRRLLVMRAGAGSSVDVDPESATIDLARDPGAARALEGRTPVVIAPSGAATLSPQDGRSALAIPVLTGGEPRGLIIVSYDDPVVAVSGEEQRFAQDVADALAVALEKAALYERTHAQAMRDPVTDLMNHRALHQVLDAALAHGAAADRVACTALLLIDVDNFKLFNDTYGHPTGDAVLRTVADILRSCARDADAARYGGDEFAMVLQGADGSAGMVVAERLAHAAADSPYVTADGSIVPLRLSIGVASAPDDGCTRQALLAVADARMYAAKRGAHADLALLRSAADLLGETSFGVLEGLVTAVDAKDRYTREHSLDVTRYALLLADALGLDAADRRTLALAGPLHDIGKIAVPDRVLRKPGALTADEYEAIKAHVTYGVAIVRGLLDDPRVLAAIAHHHERFDGQGYPHGVTGAETPLVGRILQIADAVSAMTLDRPYRRGLSREQVIAQLRRGAGAQFDPALVEPFIAALHAGSPTARGRSHCSRGAGRPARGNGRISATDTR